MVILKVFNGRLDKQKPHACNQSNFVLTGHERLFRSLSVCTENGVAARYVEDVPFT